MTSLETVESATKVESGTKNYAFYSEWVIAYLSSTHVRIVLNFMNSGWKRSLAFLKNYGQKYSFEFIVCICAEIKLISLFLTVKFFLNWLKYRCIQ